MRIDRVFYINDDKDIESRIAMESELNDYDIVSHDDLNAGFKLTFERFSTLCPESSFEIRMGKSHAAVLELATTRGYSNVIVLEDDFRFIVEKEKFYKNMENLSGVYLDVCLLAYKFKHGTNSNMHPGLVRAMQTTDTTGYLVPARYFEVLSECFKRAVSNLEHTSQARINEIDIAWNGLQSVDPWYCFQSPIGEKSASNRLKIERNSSRTM
jgi:hypothetical protein